MGNTVMNVSNPLGITNRKSPRLGRGCAAEGSQRQSALKEETSRLAART